MLSRVKLRRIFKDHKEKRLDEVLARKQKILKVNKDEEVGDFGKEDAFHQAVGPVLLVAQCLAIMPVVGVRQASPRNLRFTLRSPQAMMTFLFLFVQVTFTIGMLKKLFQVGVNAKNCVGGVFFTSVLLATILFFLLAPRWPELMRQWMNVELIFLKPPYTSPRRKLASRIQCSAIVIVLLSSVEHGLFFMSSIQSYIRQARLCNNTERLSFNSFMTISYDYVFHIIPYNMVFGILALLMNASFTFTWNYMDLFIMMVSKGLAYRFEQITTRIKDLADKDVPEHVFTELREHYVLLCELLEYVDENLSGIILLSCMNNLYFVCYQLLNIFNKLRWPINYIYFWYSLLYLIGRTAFVFLSAASINDESRAPVGILRNVSKKTWCIEVERLIFQMTSETVALSGKKFYYLTRRLLFGMAGTIVTYELVLLQFDEPNRVKGLPDLCD